ncbi:hypothetical protein Tco_1222875, partial [Tanacetum coccineum]
IDLLVQQYEQFTILGEESIDSGFARFNTIITSLKALDECFSSKNYVRKFLKALHPKCRATVMAIEESKDLSSLALDELIDNLNSLEERVNLSGNQEKKRSHSDKEMRNDETCLMAQSPNEVTLDSSHYSDNASSFDDDRYSQNSKAYIILNKHTMKVEELLNVTFDESPPPTKLSPLVDDDVGEKEATKNNIKVVNNSNIEEEFIKVDDVVNIKESKNHPLGHVIGSLNQRTLRSQA